MYWRTDRNYSKTLNLKLLLSTFLEKEIPELSVSDRREKEDKKEKEKTVKVEKKTLRQISTGNFLIILKFSFFIFFFIFLFSTFPLIPHFYDVTRHIF